MTAAVDPRAEVEIRSDVPTWTLRQRPHSRDYIGSVVEPSRLGKRVSGVERNLDRTLAGVAQEHPLNELGCQRNVRPPPDLDGLDARSLSQHLHEPISQGRFLHHDIDSERGLALAHTDRTAQSGTAHVDFGGIG